MCKLKSVLKLVKNATIFFGTHTHKRKQDTARKRMRDIFDYPLKIKGHVNFAIKVFTRDQYFLGVFCI